jgi:carbamoyl-phosphate synthase small subunit
MVGRDLASDVTTSERYDAKGESLDFIEFSSLGEASEDRCRVVAYDFGIKTNILRDLVHCGAIVTVVPSTTSAAEVLALEPDGVFLSNGPGDPQAVEYAVRNVRALLGKAPVFGICLGHQILALALGARTFKMKFGHHGGNQPVMSVDTGRVEITAQNHGFAVDPESLDDERVRITHVNLNDQTIEGIEHRNLPAFGVQYHPEASPGPHDSYYLFKKFIDRMRDAKAY